MGQAGTKIAAHSRGRLRSFAAIRHSLAVRLLASALLFSACVTLILTPLQLYLQYRHDVSDLELRLNQISKSDVDSLAERLWALDENQLRLQLAGILRLPDVRAVEVREDSSAADPLLIRLGEKSVPSPIKREYPLSYNVEGKDTRIGALYVEATLAGIHRRLFNTASTILFSQAAEIFLVSLFIVYIFHNLVTRHLFAIASFVDSYRINDPPAPLKLRRPPPHEDELQRVVTAFNTLSDNLQVAYRNLHYVNDQLIQDVAARRQVEAVLRERESRIRRLIDANIIGIFIWEYEGRILEANDAFLRITGYDRDDLASGRLHWTDLTPPEWLDLDRRLYMPEVKNTGSLQPVEKEYFRKDGSRVPVLIGIASFEMGTDQGVAFVLDISDRKRAEKERERLRQMEEDLARVNRMSMMGELAASLAHEIKQPITAAAINAKTCLRCLQREPPEIEKAREAASRIVKDVIRAAEFIDRTRSLYGRGAPKREMVNLNEFIREMIVMLHDVANRRSISIRAELGRALPTVTADRVQMQQVLMNLMLNGIEAMEDTGGELTIRSEKAEGSQILLSVSDLGIGLPVENAERIFDAFVTTKAQGTGMGLSISRRIIESHGGRLWACANTGRGATFHFTLPTDAAPASPSAG